MRARESRGFRGNLVRPERFELPTYSSGGCRSIQTELRAHCGLSSVHRGSGALNGLDLSLHSGPDSDENNC
jgi:hypothetical protein